MIGKIDLVGEYSWTTKINIIYKTNVSSLENPRTKQQSEITIRFHKFGNTHYIYTLVSVLPSMESKCLKYQISLEKTYERIYK